MLPLEPGLPESPDPPSEGEGSDLTCALTSRLPTTVLKGKNIDIDIKLSKINPIYPPAYTSIYLDILNTLGRLMVEEPRN